MKGNPMLRIEVVNPGGNQLGEGPLWDVTEQALYWIDSYGPTVYRTDSHGRRTSWALPEHVGSIALREQGGIICSLRSGFHALDKDTGEVTLIAQAAPANPRT